MNRTNYQRELDALIKTLAERPRLLLHSCCAPCSSYVLSIWLPIFAWSCFIITPTSRRSRSTKSGFGNRKSLRSGYKSQF